jgi:hypothetical protein
MSHKELIMNHLKNKGSITQMEALVTYRCWGLRARISELKQAGVPIVSEIHRDSTGKRYVKYSIVH